jgi:plasmid stability protein
MKRLQIMIDEEVDRELDVRAARNHVSKASLVRDYVRAGLRPLPPIAEDSLTALAGSADFEPADIDDTVYGR